MIRRLFGLSRYLVLIAIAATFVSAIGLMVYEALVVFLALFEIAGSPDFSPKNAKHIAVGLIEAMDVFLISIAMYMMSLSLYALFIDDSCRCRAGSR